MQDIQIKLLNGKQATLHRNEQTEWELIYDGEVKARLADSDAHRMARPHTDGRTLRVCFPMFGFTA